MTSPIVINVPTRELLAGETKSSFVSCFQHLNNKNNVCKRISSLYLFNSVICDLTEDDRSFCRNMLLNFKSVVLFLKISIFNNQFQVKDTGELE